MRKFLKDESGMGTVEIIIIIPVLVIIAYFLFKPFVPQLFGWIKGLFA